MNSIYTSLISAAQLQQRLRGPDLIVVDVRHDLAKPDSGHAAWLAGHIPGAKFLHVDTDLSGPKNGQNGRHPLPARAAFAATLRDIGVDAGSQVVAYDASGGMFAARLWWMLRWLGHANVAVLDGGLPAWIAADGALEAGESMICASGDFIARDALVASVDADALLANLDSGARLVVDARAPERYRGDIEPLDPVGGHIPGAVNRFYQLNLAADGRFKSAQELNTDFQALLGARRAADIVHQCGSGVTACHNLLAMEVAGLPGAALYPGSWSEWCASPARPVAKG